VRPCRANAAHQLAPVVKRHNERCRAETACQCDHLPLRTLEARDLAAHGDSTQSDPLLGILGALADLLSVMAGWS
jgi:hypothetical protein